MRPKIAFGNVKKALRHPALITMFLKGSDEAELAKKHIFIHLEKLSKMNLHFDRNLSNIELVSRAIDVCSNPCYHTQYLYLVARLLPNSVFVETGVHYGASSAFILKGLEKHQGCLYSIDLPNVEYVTETGKVHLDSLSEKETPGFAVPFSLRSNWDLRMGDTRHVLPKLLNEIGSIDVFHHDSEHTYDLMTFEYETVLPYLRSGGLLLSDDADWNNSFKDFCSRNSLEHRIYRHIGIAVKS